MRTVRTGEKAVQIWLSGEPVPEAKDILAIVRGALAERGFLPWPETQAECFAAGEDVLVLARPAAPRRRAFYFDGRESLLACAHVLPGTGGAVYGLPRGGFLMTLEAAELNEAIFEFADERSLHPLWETFAREHGLCVIPENALEKLKNAPP